MRNMMNATATTGRSVTRSGLAADDVGEGTAIAREMYAP
jgi:hypothetical protein